MTITLARFANPSNPSEVGRPLEEVQWTRDESVVMATRAGPSQVPQHKCQAKSLAGAGRG